MSKQTNKAVIESYFKSFETGDLETILQHFHPECLIVSVREGQRAPGQLHGTYQGLQEAQVFLNNIHNLFEPVQMVVASLLATDQEVVYANGRFVHRVKATGKLFSSDWVQRCVVQDGKIKEYRFFEDSAAFEQAMLPNKHQS